MSGHLSEDVRVDYVCIGEDGHVETANPFAKDCLLTLVKSSLALGSPGCLVVCHQAENG